MTHLLVVKATCSRTSIEVLRDRRPFRVWGLLENVLRAANLGRWAFLGCVSVEQRSIVGLQLCRPVLNISDLLMFSIADSSRSRFFTESTELTQSNRRTLTDQGISLDVFREHQLLAPFGAIQSSIDEFLNGCVARNLIVDLSSMPKKVFFFVVKRAIQRGSQFENILAVYSEPERYSNDPLAENPQQWSTLPGFDGPPAVTRAT